MHSDQLHTLLGRSTWPHRFAPGSLHDGLTMFRSGRNVDLTHEQNGEFDTLIGRIDGPEGSIECRVRLSSDGKDVQLSTTCGCRMPGHCHHAVAVLALATEYPPERWSRDSPVAWDRWLDSLRAPPARFRTASPERRFGLLLRAEGATEHPFDGDQAEEHDFQIGPPPRGLLAMPVWLRPAKRGDSLVDPQPLSSGRHGPEPAPQAGWTEEDGGAIGLLIDHATARHGNLLMARIDRPHLEQALLQLMARHPVYFEKPSLGAYTLSEPRAPLLSWQDLQDGNQRLCLDVGKIGADRLLHTGTGLWYVDDGSKTIGKVDVAPDRLEALARAPLLPPEMVAVFREKLAVADLPLAVPEPVDRGPPRILDCPPRALLRLRAQPLTSDWYRRMHRDERGRIAGCARLFIEYGPIRLPPGGAGSVRRLHDGSVYRIERRPVEEKALIERIASLGLIDASMIAYEIGYDPAPFQRNDLLLRPSRKRLPLTPEEWQPSLRALAEAGVRLEYEHDFPRDDLVEVGDWHAELREDGNAWFELSLGIDIDGERVDLLPIMRRLLGNESFPLKPLPNERDDATWRLRLDENRSVELPLSRLRGLIEPLLEWLETERGDTLRLHRSQEETLAGLTSLHWRGDEAMRGRVQAQRAAARTAVDAPPGFGAVLRPYQREGLAWLNFLAEAELGGVLADDMGLGKTVQVLAHLLMEKQRGRLDSPALVVCPTSLVGNWRDESARFAPDLRVLVIHGSDRADAYEAIGEHDLVITAYPLLPRDRERLIERQFALLILDEAQAVKNARSQAARVVRELRARRRLAMNGTPLENHLGELWAQFDAIEPGLLGDERSFTRLFRTPIERHGDRDRQQRLNRRIGPLLLRRRKDEVLDDLPAKTEIVRRIELEGDQRALYEALRLAQHERVREAVAKRGLNQSGIIVLDALLKLRQACCDPRLVKLDSARKTLGSAKREALHELLDGLLDEGRRVLLFSQFTEMLDLLQADLQARDIAHLRLTGDTPAKQRTGLVRRFQSGEVPLFLISLKAGGVGLNLTAADTVIHYDPWWNPAVENQATDRAHRIGQDKPVFVYKLICVGTVEEKIQALQGRKSELAQAVLEGGGSQRLRFDEADLEALFAPM